MKILQVNALYEKFSTGRLVMELSEYLTKNGHASYVAAVDLCTLTENCYKIGNELDHMAHAVLSRISGKQAFFSIGATKNLLKYIDSIKPDIVHLHNLHSNYINIKILFDYLGSHNIPTVITLHDNWFYTGKCNYYIQYGCNRWCDSCGNCPDVHSGNRSLFFDRSREVLMIKKQLYKKLSDMAVIGVSNWVTEDAKKSILKDAEIIECIYNWIDLDIFKPVDIHKTEALKKDMRLSGKKVILGVAAGWNKVKGIDIFYQLADLLSDDCRIILIGDDSEVTERHPKIIYYGKTENVNQLAEFYSMADVFVNPTIQETFGKTTAEALACGIPVVAYNSTATPELVGTDGICGILVDNNECNEYLSAVISVLSKGKEYFSFATRNRALSLFSGEKNIEQYLDVYRRITKGK